MTDDVYAKLAARVESLIGSLDQLEAKQAQMQRTSDALAADNLRLRRAIGLTIALFREGHPLAAAHVLTVTRDNVVCGCKPFLDPAVDFDAAKAAIVANVGGTHVRGRVLQ